MLNFDLQTESDRKSTLVTLRGDFDVQVAQHVAERLTEIEAEEPELLVMDLSRLSFLDSSGMGVIAATHGRARAAGRRFVVVNPPYGVRRAFEISELDKVIPVADDLAAVYP